MIVFSIVLKVCALSCPLAITLPHVVIQMLDTFAPGTEGVLGSGRQVRVRSEDGDMVPLLHAFLQGRFGSSGRFGLSGGSETAATVLMLLF